MKMSDEQLPTVPVSIAEIMASPRFQRGVTDARSRKPFPPDYDAWAHEDKLWAYERGRMWGRLVPRTVPLKRDGKVTREAFDWYRKIGDGIP